MSTKVPLALDARPCDQYRRGLCAAIKVPTYCPPERAENCPPAACCHHPLFEIKARLIEMRDAGVNLARWGEKIKDPEFVRAAYEVFRKARTRHAR